MQNWCCVWMLDVITNTASVKPINCDHCTNAVWPQIQWLLLINFVFSFSAELKMQTQILLQVYWQTERSSRLYRRSLLVSTKSSSYSLILHPLTVQYDHIGACLSIKSWLICTINTVTPSNNWPYHCIADNNVNVRITHTHDLNGMHFMENILSIMN